MSFQGFVLRKQYERVRGLGDRLELMREQINWEPFRPLVASVFHDNKVTGGRPHTDEILVVRCMLLQAWYGLSDPELEYQCCDRLSFRNFLSFPEDIPDFSTIWRIRDRLREADLEQDIWGELQHQLDAQGYKVKKGVIQDASFIAADPGRKRRQREKKARQKGESVTYTKKQKAHIDQDARYAVKNNQIHYGYKSHLKVDVDHNLIRNYQVTPANIHDGEVDLTREGDVAAYRDRGYTGKPLTAQKVKDETMQKATRNRKLNGGQQKRNKRISRTRAPGERPYSVIKRTFHNGYTYVKSLPRVAAKEMFKYFAYNLYQLVTLERRKLGVIT